MAEDAERAAQVVSTRFQEPRENGGASVERSSREDARQSLADPPGPRPDQGRTGGEVPGDERVSKAAQS